MRNVLFIQWKSTVWLPTYQVSYLMFPKRKNIQVIQTSYLLNCCIKSISHLHLCYFGSKIALVWYFTCCCCDIDNYVIGYKYGHKQTKHRISYKLPLKICVCRVNIHWSSTLEREIVEYDFLRVSQGWIPSIIVFTNTDFILTYCNLTD